MIVQHIVLRTSLAWLLIAEGYVVFRHNSLETAKSLGNGTRDFSLVIVRDSGFRPAEVIALRELLKPMGIKMLVIATFPDDYGEDKGFGVIPSPHRPAELLTKIESLLTE